MSTEIIIQRENGRYLINGKQYAELSFSEKKEFDDFLFEMRDLSEAAIHRYIQNGSLEKSANL